MIHRPVTYTEIYNSIMRYCGVIASQLNIPLEQVYNYDFLASSAALKNTDSVGFSGFKVTGQEGTNLVGVIVSIGFSVVSDHNLNRLNTQYLNHISQQLIPNGKIPVVDQDGHIIDYLMCSNDFEFAPPNTGEGVTLAFLTVFLRSAMVLNAPADGANADRGCA